MSEIKPQAHGCAWLPQLKADVWLEFARRPSDLCRLMIAVDMSERPEPVPFSLLFGSESGAVEIGFSFIGCLQGRALFESTSWRPLSAQETSQSAWLSGGVVPLPAIRRQQS